MDYYKQLRTFVGHRPVILPGSLVIVVNGNDEILLQHRRDGWWGLPGGLMELGESLEETAARELLEETGLTVRNLQLLGVFSGRRYFFRLANGDEFYAVSALYVTRDYDGQLQIDETESRDVRFFDVRALPLDDMLEQHRHCIETYMKQ